MDMNAEDMYGEIVDDFLKDENDPVHGEFNRKWNEQVRKQSNKTVSQNKKTPFSSEREDRKMLVDDIRSTKESPNNFHKNSILNDFIGTHIPEGKRSEVADILSKAMGSEDFYDREFNFPGGQKPVTGRQVLETVESFGMSKDIGSVAGFNPSSRAMLFNPLLLETLSPAEIATTLSHEYFHAGALASGSLNPEKLQDAVSAGANMTPEQARYIGQQEGIADTFSKGVLSDAGIRPGISAYDTTIDTARAFSEATNMPLPENLEDYFRGQGVDPNLRMGLSSYLGVNANDRTQIGAIKDAAETPQFKAMQEGYNENIKFYNSKSANIVGETRKKTDDLLKIGEPVDIKTRTSPKFRGDGNVFMVDPDGTTRKVNLGAREAAQEAADLFEAEIKGGARGGSRFADDATKTGSRLFSGNSIANQVVKGASNSSNLRAAGLAALLGAAGVGLSAKARKNNKRADVSAKMNDNQRYR
jgi:hypothetical protein